jgi:transcriptional regulator with XRE-family HTH domain
MLLVVGPNESGNVQLGEILHTLRDKANLSRTEAAEKFEVSSEFLRLIERGKRVPALGTMRNMLQVYDVNYHVDGNTIIFEKTTVEFTSRIQEARHKSQKIPVDLSRDEILGQIVRLLVIADDITLRRVHTRLLNTHNSRGNHAL